MSNYQVGLDVVKGVSNGLNPIQTPALNTVGLLMKRFRGIPGKLYKITEQSQDELFFGGSVPGYYGFETVRNLFLNSAPTKPILYGARLVASDAVAATTSFVDLDSNLEFTVKAGQKGQEDPGSWANGYVINIQAIPRGLSQTDWAYTLKDPSGNVVETASYISWSLLRTFLEEESDYVVISEVTDPDTTPTGSSTIDGAISGFLNLNTYVRTVQVLVDGSVDPLDQIKPGLEFYNNSTGSELKVGTIETVTVTRNLTNNIVTIKFRASDYDIAALGSGPTPDPTTNLLVQDIYSTSQSLSSGSDGNFLESDAYPGSVAGLDVFNGVNIKVIGVVDIFTSTMLSIGKDYAMSRGDTFYVQSAPLNATDSELEDLGSSVRNASISYAAVYHGWNYTFLPATNKFGYIPSIGAALGSGYVRAPFLAGNFIHIPPAGINTIFADSLGVSTSNVSRAQINSLAQEYGINVIVNRENVGSYINTSRTTSSNTLYHSIHTVIQANYYQQILQDNMLWAVQAPLVPELTDSILNYLSSFFLNEYNNGALERSIPFSEACSFSVNNTTSRKVIDIEIRYIPTEATESVLLRLNRNDGQLIINVE